MLSLCKPAAGEVGWTDSDHGNWDILDALFVAPGVLKTAKGGLGFDASLAGNGTLPIGNGAGLTLAALTAGSGISIVTAAGGITISTSGPPGGGALALAGTLTGTGLGDYSTTSASFVDVDAVNLTVPVTVPAAAKFILVMATFALGASVIVDGAAHVRFLVAGQAIGAGCLISNTFVSAVGVYTLYGVAPNPTAGAQTIALQFAGDGANAVVMKNPAQEGTNTLRPRLLYAVTN